MSGRWIAAAVLALAARSLEAQGGFGWVDVISIEPDERVSAISGGDFDGDGRRDLLVAVRDEDKSLGERRLGIRLSRAPGEGFSASPDRLLPLPADVTAIAVGDFDADPGDEVMLFSSRSAVIYRSARQGTERFVRVGDCRFLWQVPHAGRLINWSDGVQDLDGDGLADLVLPEPDGFRVFWQSAEAGGKRVFGTQFLEPPPDREVEESAAARVGGGATAGRSGGGFSLKLDLPVKRSDGLEEREPLVEVEEAAPRPVLVDFDGDGRIDVVCRTAHKVLVFVQHEGRTFAARPDLVIDSPLVADRDRRVDFSYSTRFLDLDGDRRADCLFFAGDRNSKEAATQVLAFAQRGDRIGAGLFGTDGRPTAFLKIAGFAGDPILEDLDGDGRIDLAMGSYRPEVVDALSGGLKKEVEIEAYVWLGREAGFAREPDARFPLTLQSQGLSSLRSASIARPLGDLTGDGLAELLIRDRKDRIVIRRLKREREALVLDGRPLLERRIDEDAALHFLAPTRNEAAGFAVISKGRIDVLRFGR